LRLAYARRLAPRLTLSCRFALTHWLAFGLALARILARSYRLAFGRHLAGGAGVVALTRRPTRLARSCRAEIARHWNARLSGAPDFACKAGERIGRAWLAARRRGRRGQCGLGRPGCGLLRGWNTLRPRRRQRLAHRCGDAHDIGLNHHVAPPADHEEVLDIVAPDQDEAAASGRRSALNH
jgi:hypothetical protein